MPLKVGELARRSGVSVRTLHHYDEIGLLSASFRSESGHRLYTDVDVVRSGQNPTTDEILHLMEDIHMHEKYYAKEQLHQLKERTIVLGEDAIRQAENDWPILIQAVRAEMERNADPASAAVQALAKRWSALIAMFTGGDAGIAKSLGTMYQQEGSAKASRAMLDEATIKYINEAIKLSS